MAKQREKFDNSIRLTSGAENSLLFECPSSRLIFSSEFKSDYEFLPKNYPENIILRKIGHFRTKNCPFFSGKFFRVLIDLLLSLKSSSCSHET